MSSSASAPAHRWRSAVIFSGLTPVAAASLASALASASGCPCWAGSREVCASARERLNCSPQAWKPGYTAVVVMIRTTLGVVRWRLATLVDRLSGLLGSQEHRSMGSPITDEEIENLFS